MSTIPASELVRVNPNVLSAGGDALVLQGMVLTENWRVPVGQPLSFQNDGVSVSDFFGANAVETEIANIYFNGFNHSTQKPASILFAQYPAENVGAWMLGGPVNQYTIPQLKALTGSLTVVVDGYTYTNGSVSLSAATSYSSAAAIIETALNNTLPQAASVTGAIAAGTASVTGSIAGNVLYVTDILSGTLHAGVVLSGTGVTSGTKISKQLSGTTGGIGTYAVTEAQVVDSTTIGATFGTLTVTAVGSGTLSLGQVLSGSGVTANTTITDYGTGEGLTGTYIVDLTQTAASTTITAKGAALNVDYDSVSGGFVVYSGSTGAGSTIAFATGTLAASIYWTENTGAVLSQGANAQTPAEYMTALIQYTQNWATFMLVFDPDAGEGCVQKLAFSDWVNDQNKRWAYIARDTDVTPTESSNATSSMGNILQADGTNGTCVIYDPDTEYLDAFICGAAASIDFAALNGRITFAYKGQDGLTASVTNATVASNLIANGYNFYGAYATANDNFILFQPGSVSGEFSWLDSYVNQIWLNNALQLALMDLLANINSIPYNQFGYGLIAAACMDPINAGLNFGAIRPGVTLSSSQAAQVNAAAGQRVDDIIYAQGWFLQIVDASPQVRAARQSPPCNFWYTDGQSVQKIVLNSTEIE